MGSRNGHWDLAVALECGDEMSRSEVPANVTMIVILLQFSNGVILNNQCCFILTLFWLTLRLRSSFHIL